MANVNVLQFGTFRHRASRPGLFMANFALRMPTNCYFGASDPNIDTAVGFGDPSYMIGLRIFWRAAISGDHITLTFDPLNCNTWHMLHSALG